MKNKKKRQSHFPALPIFSTFPPHTPPPHTLVSFLLYDVYTINHHFSSAGREMAIFCAPLSPLCCLLQCQTHVHLNDQTGSAPHPPTHTQFILSNSVLFIYSLLAKPNETISMGGVFCRDSYWGEVRHKKKVSVVL